MYSSNPLRMAAAVSCGISPDMLTASSPDVSESNTESTETKSHLTELPSRALLRRHSDRSLRGQQFRSTFSLGHMNRSPERPSSPVDSVDFKNFDFVLHEPILCAGFRKFLRASFCEENLEFWKKVEWFRTLTDEQDIRKESQNLFQHYLGDEAIKPVYISSEIQDVLRMMIESGKSIDKNLLERIQLEAHNVMRLDSFRNFTSHPLFRETCELYKQVHALTSDDSSPLTSRAPLTQRDWKFLLTGAQEVTLAEGTTFIEQGTPIKELYRLVSGQVRITRTRENGERYYRRKISEAGTPIGAAGILDMPSQFSATCKSAVVLQRVDFQYVLRLFSREPDLAQRFYSLVGKELGVHLDEISATHAELDRFLENSCEVEEPQSEPAAFHDIFRTEECLLKEYPCALEKIFVRRGQLYTTADALYFTARLFGQRTRLVIPLRTIASLGLRAGTRSHSIIIRTHKRRRYKFLIAPELSANVHSVICDLLGAVNPDVVFESSPEASVLPMDGGGMSADDWDTLLCHPPTLKREDAITTFYEGDQIIEEGQFYQMFCYIASGSCRVEKRLKEQEVSVVLGHLEQGDVFGEISFFSHSLATATVVADTNVEVYIITPALCEKLFSHSPQVGLRFYHFLCLALFNRIAQRESDGWGYLG